MGEFNGELGDLKIEVSFDKKKNTIPHNVYHKGK
jgi:hypothetical protein